jgi:adenylate cyclase
MQAPPTPTNEAERLAALRSLGILDTPKEERFDRLCRIAAHVFDVPIAIVSLVDSNRQWFKSCVGLDASQTGRDVSFCGHAILERESLVIPDAREDVRFHDNPLVTGAPNIRFYAGRVVHGPGRNNLGTLCLIDSKPRVFSAEDQKLHADLAAVVERELNLTEIVELQEQLVASQKEAGRLLRNILPDSVAARLKGSNEIIADDFREATVLVAMLHDFTGLTRALEARQEVALLNEIFCGFDELAIRHGVEKIKTLEAGYLAATGLPEARPDHLEAMADFALALQSLIVQLDPQGQRGLNLRIGLDTGSVVAGVIGRSRFSYDIWGDTVDAAWELAHLGMPGSVQINDAVRRRLEGRFLCEPRGEYYLKSKGAFQLHLLRGHRGAS